ncbi:UNVERIFIED_CONTAM: hypothetical protein Sindi_2129800 [Sesamum indicum]
MSVNDFRPISCCNVLYKIIAKLLVQRLSVLLDKIISPCQTTFIPGRSIGDNIMLAQELFSGYNQMRLSPICALKVDIRKAYDTEREDYDRETPYLLICLSLLWKLYIYISYNGLSRTCYSPTIGSSLQGRIGLVCGIVGPSIERSKKPLNHQPFGTSSEGPDVGNFGFLGGAPSNEVQIIKSMLSTLSLYWASAFILSKKVINEIEKRLRTFLWKGTTSSGYTKVALKDVCRPADEGRLGFKDLSILNHVLMSKKLCDVIRCDGISIWVQWLYQGQLRDTSIWTVTKHGGSWGWRKMLRLRPFLRSIVDYQIGTGERFYIWQDPWHPLGPLIERFPRGPRHLGLEKSAKLSLVISAGEWHWPLITDFECLEITHNFPVIVGGEDRVVWRYDGGQPTTQSLYRLFDPTEPKVACIYHIWRERNLRIFEHTERTPDTLSNLITDDVR